MLLQRLREYALQHEDTPPFHRSRGFTWRLPLDMDGNPLSADLQPLVEVDGKGRSRPMLHTTPAIVRTVGVAAQLAADDIQYVLGWPDPTSKPARVADCHAAFVDLTDRWAHSLEGSQDPTAQAVAAFYRHGGPAAIRCAEPYTAKDAVLITVNGQPAYQAPSVVPFWTSEVTRRKGSDRVGLCLVCGHTQPLLDTVPGKIPARLVPGATNDAALVSVNERVFGYDLTTQLAASPLCLACGEAIISSLHALLDSRHATAYGDSRLTWWISNDGDDRAVRLLFEPSPEDVNDLIATIHSGRKPSTNNDDDDMFYSLTVGGNVARVMVRDWVEMPLPALKRNIAGWFADHEIVSVWHADHVHSIGRLALVTGRWHTQTSQYAPFGAKGAQRPESVYRDLTRTALRGTPLPPNLLAHLVNRVRADHRLDDPRAALLRLALVRSPHVRKKPMPNLDESNDQPTYVAGRLFAAYEQLQYDTYRARDGHTGTKLNTTFSDRYFAGALTSPRAVLITGGRDAQAWLKKLRGRNEKAAYHHQRVIANLYRLLGTDNPIPARMTPLEQATFLLGYHHQRAHQMPKPKTPDTNEADTAEPSTTEETTA